MNLKERVEKILEIADKAKLLKALPLKEPAEHEDGVECYLCCGEGSIETEIAEFQTEYESISAGIQCFGYGDQLTASMNLVEAIPKMLEIIKELQEENEKLKAKLKKEVAETALTTIDAIKYVLKKGNNIYDILDCSKEAALEELQRLTKE